MIKVKYFDIARFEPDMQFLSRLGYGKVYCVGRDVELAVRPGGARIPQIVASADQGVLFAALKDSNVIGIIFEGNEPIKKVVEKAKELGKPVFLPINVLIGQGQGARGHALGRLRKAAYACIKSGAQARIISLAETREQMISAGQMTGIADLILGQGEGHRIFGSLQLGAAT